jgi:dTDP-4-amino-4,6-dideoxygalactose transaminase
VDVPLLDLKAQYASIRGEVEAAVDAVFESQQFVLGRNVSALEEEIARYCGVSYAVAVASGSDALLLSMKALGVGPGDAVVTVPFTFFATAGAIVNLGARPLFVDIDGAGYGMDAEQLSLLLEKDCTFNAATQKLVHRSTSSNVKAILPVHLYGQCADMDEIREVAQKYRLPIVEDSCQAIGARYRDKEAGGLGDLGCFSFFPSKNLGGAGDGGMVVTRRKDLAQQVRLLRGHGAQPKYFHSIVGYNSRLDELQAAVLRVKLAHLDRWIESRQRNAAEYGELFQTAGLLSKIAVPEIRMHRTHTFHQYVIRAADRDHLRTFLQSHGIGTEIYYPLPLHQQECFRYLGYDSSGFPRSRSAAAQTLALPVYPEMTADQKSYVVRTIVEFYASAR